MTTTYQYKTLEDPDNEIRLAMIQPGAFDDDIRISFILRKIEEQTPVYEALSYAWGADENPSFVIVGDPETEHTSLIASGSKGEETTITVTRNLDVALRYLRYPAEHRVIWIDALCIDQRSTDEKNRQVAVMGRVFERARPVVFWIGPEGNRSNEALNIIEHIGRCVTVDWLTEGLRPSGVCTDDEKHWADLAEELPYRDGALDPVSHLFERPYFNRVWIRQEIALATSRILKCGNRSVESEIFRGAIACIYRKRFHRDSLSNGRYRAFVQAKRSLMEICCTSAGGLIYRDLRHYLGGSKCRDPRDKIFSVLALLYETDMSLDIRPDYSREVENLYTDVATRFYVKRRSLNLLESCVLSSRTLEIPSWVPDWSIPLPRSRELRAHWSACAWLSQEDLTVDKGRLRSTGVAASFVRETIEPFWGEYEIERCVEVIKILRRLKPTPNGLAVLNMTTHCWAANFCFALLEGCSAESYLPPEISLPESKVFIEAVLLVQSTDLDFETLEEQTILPLRQILHLMSEGWDGLCLFVCDNGYVGCSFPGVQEGDTVNVLLGCMFPVILRPSPQSAAEDPQTWQVVSAAMVTGLMKGEAIYGDKLSPYWRAVRHFEEEGTWIDRFGNGFYDSKTDTLEMHPVEILSQMGIRVESYQRTPHLLQVLPETLRASGVPLREFILV